MDDRDVIGVIIDEMRNDAVLSSYVKSFTTGDMDAPRKIFPWVAVGNLECGIGVLTQGRMGYDVFSYTMEIRAGVRNMAPGESFMGEHGILQLCEDIVSAIRPKDFGGMFSAPVEILSIAPGWRKDSGSTIWTGHIAIKGEKKIRRTK